MNSIIAPFVVGVLSLCTLCGAPSAKAAPFGSPAASSLHFAAPTMTPVNHEGRHRYHRSAAGTAAGAAIGWSALALGAALMEASRGPRNCTIERVEVWSAQREAYVSRNRQVCR